MKRLNRVAIFSVLTIMGFIFTAKPAAAISFVDWFKNTTSIEKNVGNTIKARVDAIEKGDVTLDSHVPETEEAFSAHAFTLLNGVSKSSPALNGMTESQKKIVYEKYGNGVIGQTSEAIAMLYTPPASGTTYVAELLQSAHIIPQAQAQGLGFASLDPVLETWKIFRNVAYFFFVVVFLAIGFMIMFRQKIGGQTVVTAQQAIPGIIISLIFVTFSYAIAGFLIDLMYLIMYLMIGIFQPAAGAEIMSKTFLHIGWDLVTGVNGAGGAYSSMNDAVKEFAGSIDTTALGDVLGWLGGLTLGLIVSIAILIGIFKLFFELLKIYITIILAIVAGPVLLMMGAIPGKSNVGYWIKMVFGNLMAFPMVLFSLILFEMFTKNDLSSGGFMPPFMVGRGAGSVIMSLVGIGIVMIIPELIKEMKKAMKIDGGIWEALAFKALDQAKEGAPLGAKVVGAGVGAGVGAAGGLFRGIDDIRGQKGISAWDKAVLIAQSTGRGIGNATGKGVSFGGKVASMAGGKTPSYLAPVETAVDKGSSWFSDDERINRIANNQDILGRDNFSKKDFGARADRARRQLKRSNEEKYGEEPKAPEEEKAKPGE